MVLSGLLIDSISVTGLYQVHVNVDSRVFGIVLTFKTVCCLGCFQAVIIYWTLV